MREVTVIEPLECDEIMVNFDSSTNKVLQVYCWAKDIPVIHNEKNDSERDARTYKMKNELFRRLHLGDFNTYCKQACLVVSMVDPEEEDFSEEEDKSIREFFAEQYPSIELL